MANGDDKVVNQNTEPVNTTTNVPSKNIITTKSGKVIDLNEVFTESKQRKEQGIDIENTNLTGRSIGGTSWSAEAIDKLQSYEQTYESLRKNAVEQQYDGVISTGLKVASSFYTNVAAGLWDTVGVIIDPADIRLPTIGGGVDFVTSLFGAETNIGDYSKYVEPTFFSNEVFKFLDNYTIFGDGDEFGNIATRRASFVREWDRAVNTVKYENENFNWVSTIANYGPQIFGSVGSVLLSGGAVGTAAKGISAFGGGLRGLTAIQQAVRAEAAAGTLLGKAKQALNTLGGAFLMTESTGFSIAQEVYNESYQNKLFSLAPQLETAAQSAYEQTKQKLLNEGSWAGDAEAAALKAKKDYIRKFANENPEYHSSASKTAGKGAEVAIKAMTPAFLLNLTMSSAFVKTFIGEPIKKSVTRGLIKKSPFNKRAMLFEGGQEYIEEWGIESLAEDVGKAAGAGLDYTISDAWNTLSNWENIVGGITGFGVGTGIKGGLDFYKRGEHKKNYDEQQAFIKEWNKIGASIGQPDIVEQLTAPIQSAQKVNEILQEVNKLEAEGKTDEAKAASKKILAIQAFDAYKSGTTKVLIDNWQKIADDSTLKPEVRNAAKIAIQEIIGMENDFNEAIKYENSSHVFKNRINQRQDTKLAQELKNKIAEKKIEAQSEVALLKQAGKLDLSYDEIIEQTKEIEWNKDGTIKEVVTPAITEKKEIELELTPKGYVSTVEGVNASKQLEQIKNQVKPYQEFLDLNEQLEATEIRIAEANAAYADMTSKENQKNLKYQNMILQEYKSIEKDLVESFGTDKYMNEVDSKILNHYKNKMDPKAFELFRQKTFVNKNNRERAVRELAEKAQLEEGLKSDEQARQETEEVEKEIPFANIPKETKIELVANKLVQGIPLSAEEERFKNSNSIKVENKRIELEKIKANDQTSDVVTPETANEEGTVTDEKTQIAGNINNIIESEPEPQIPLVGTKSKLDTLIDKHNPNLNEQQKATLEKELNKEKPNENLIASLLKVKKPVAQEIITQYKLNEEAVESNTDADLINFTNDIKQQIDASGQNSINFDLETEEVVDEFGNVVDEVLTEKAKAQLELIKRLQGSNNTDLVVIPNKSIPNRYKFAIPLSNDPKEDSDAYVEDDLKSFDPKEISDRLSPEAKNQLKEQVGDYIIALEEELGSEPTFEKFIRDYIVNSSKEQAKILFDTLALGWELNGMPIENYKEVYDKVFKSRKEIANSLMQFAEEQQLVEKEFKEQVNKSNLENNTSKKPVETASGDTVFVPIPLLGDAVFRLGYNSTNLSARFTKVTTEEGEIVTLIETFEEEDIDNIDKFKDLLRRDKFKPGTQLSVQLGVNNLNTILIKDRDENGQVLFDENGKPKLIQFGEWVKRNVEKEGMNFLNSQAYYDAAPLTVKHPDGSPIAYIHDVTKISTDNSLNAEQKTKQIADLRALRKYLIDTEKKGGTPKIEITSKTAGMIKKYPNNQTKRIRSIDKNAVLVKGIVDNNNQVSHVYVSNGSKSVIMPIAEFYIKFKIKNANEDGIQKALKLGATLDVRAWSEDGGHQIYNTKFPTLSEELVESIMNALSLGLDKETKRTLESNLKAQFNNENIDNFITKFIRLNNPKNVENGKPYIEIKNFNVSDYKAKILFGVKGGEEFVIESQEDFNKHKDKLAKFLSEQRLNTKNKLINPSLDSNELKMGLVDEDGSIIDSPFFNYFEHSMKDTETDVVLENIGTAENPHFITRFQPNIEFKPVESPNRNSNNYSSPKPETKEENKQLSNLVANTFTDEQLAKEIPNLEAQGFQFIGNTLEEKVADAKKLLSENSNESTELAKQLDDNLKEKLEQKTEETQTPLEGFEEFFNIFAESSNVDEAIQKLIDNKTITKDCK